MLHHEEPNNTPAHLAFQANGVEAVGFTSTNSYFGNTFTNAGGADIYGVRIEMRGSSDPWTAGGSNDDNVLAAAGDGNSQVVMVGKVVSALEIFGEVLNSPFTGTYVRLFAP